METEILLEQFWELLPKLKKLGSVRDKVKPKF